VIASDRHHFKATGPAGSHQTSAVHAQILMLTLNLTLKP